MRQTLMKIEVIKREDMVLRSYTIMNETVKTLIASMKKPIPSEKNKLIRIFEKDIVNKGLVSKDYLNVFLELEKMKRLVDEGNVLKIPKERILLNREYVRKFIREAGRVIKERKFG